MLRITRRTKVLLLVLASTLATSLAASAQTPEEAATNAALVWLQNYIDNPQYGEAHAWSAVYLRERVEEANFVAALENFRRPLGSRLSRTLVSRVYKTSLEAMPDGEYVVIEFQTKLSNKAAAKELITMQKEWWNGKWWPLGYSIE